MRPRIKRAVIYGCFVLVCMTAVVHLSSYVLYHRPLEKRAETDKRKLSGLQVLELEQFGNQSDFKCINAKVGGLTFPMCIYNPLFDIYISKPVDNGDYFEPDLVEKILNLFRTHPNMSFVDLGANLGTYSLPIAHSGFQVISVEPNEDTVRRLATSVNLGRIQNNIEIFHYALSNEESRTFLKFDVRNRGDTFFAENNGSCPGCLSAKVTVLDKLIPFIRHQKAFIKIDTQETEIKIFQRKSAAKFFKEIDVVMIQMEWDLYRTRYGKTDDERRRIARFLDFFYQRDYDVYDPRTEQKLDADWTKWPYDILFKKANLPKSKLFII